VQTIFILGTPFQRKRNKQFIPLPWRVGEIYFKHISHLDEFDGQLDQLILKEEQSSKGFDPKNLFSAHMSLVEYSSYFSKSEEFKEGGGDNQNINEASIEETMNDIDVWERNNDCYKQKGREETSKNPNSPNISQICASTKTKPRSSGLEPRRKFSRNLDKGGEK
jgi:hypothetical protein